MERKSFGDAIVIGGSMAGLLAARVLADHFETVTVIERDEPMREARGAPWRPAGTSCARLAVARPGHDLPAVPRRREELLAAGATPVNMGRDMRWFHFGVWKCRYHSALDFISASRPLIEWTIAERVRRLPNVKMLHGWCGRGRDVRRAQRQRSAHAPTRRSRSRAATERGSRHRRKRPRLADSRSSCASGLRAPPEDDGAHRRRLRSCMFRTPRRRATGRCCTSSRSRRRSAPR